MTPEEVELAKVRARRYHHKHKDEEGGNRDRHLRRKYGITLKEYDVLLEAQNGVCAICGGIDVGKKLAVDHCHETGKIRGLLCSRCNPALGFMLDKVDNIDKFVEYLKRGE